MLLQTLPSLFRNIVNTMLQPRSQTFHIIIKVNLLLQVLMDNLNIIKKTKEQRRVGVLSFILHTWKFGNLGKDVFISVEYLWSRPETIQSHRSME